MSIAGPSSIERFYRMVNVGVSLAPVPWLPAIVMVIKEIYDIVERIKMVRPQCRQLAQEVSKITAALEEHSKAHPGNSQLEDMKEVLLFIVRQIKDDLVHWTNYNRIMRFYRHRDVLERIDHHRGELGKATQDLMFKGTLVQDVDSAKKDENLKLMQAEVDNLKRRIDQDAQKTAIVKEEWRTARMLDVDDIKKVEDKIFSLRLDPETFPDADMQGEVTKTHCEAHCVGFTFDIFKAVWFDRKYVAAKRYRGRDWALTAKEEERFMRQMNIWRTFKHPNIVPLYGICRFENYRPPYLISPWMMYGSVTQYLKEFAEEADRLKLIHGVALGLKYIHSVGVLHGNLNPNNVLVNMHHCARLTGFSLSKELTDDVKYTRSNNNLEFFRWWSPETMHERVLSEQSDVWSWGMTALEILSGEIPFKEERYPLAIREAVDDDILPEPEDYEKEIANERIWTLMRDCWKPYGTRAEVEHIVRVVRQERMKQGWDPEAPAPELKPDPKKYPEMF